MGMPRLVTDDMIDRATAMVRDGKTVVEAATTLGILQVTLRARLRHDAPQVLQASRANWERRLADGRRKREQRIAERKQAAATRWRRWKLTREQAEAAAHRIARGELQYVIAAEYGMTTLSLGRAIKALGLPGAPPGRGGRSRMADRSEKMVIHAWVPKDLVKRVDHARIDHGIRTRAEVVKAALEWWLEHLASDDVHDAPAAGERRGT